MSNRVPNWRWMIDLPITTTLTRLRIVNHGLDVWERCDPYSVCEAVREYSTQPHSPEAKKRVLSYARWLNAASRIQFSVPTKRRVQVRKNNPVRRPAFRRRK